jgi:hypothetical protein
MEAGTENSKSNPKYECHKATKVTGVLVGIVSGWMGYAFFSGGQVVRSQRSAESEPKRI